MSFAEIILILVVAVIFLGPKEIPTVVRAIVKVMQFIKSITREARALFDELAKESGMKEEADKLNDDISLIKGDDGKFYESYDISKIEKNN
jgi:sec-independent protein translocase protein TatB